MCKRGEHGQARLTIGMLAVGFGLALIATMLASFHEDEERHLVEGLIGLSSTKIH